MKKACLIVAILVLAGCPCDPETGIITAGAADGIYTDGECRELPDLSDIILSVLP